MNVKRLLPEFSHRIHIIVRREVRYYSHRPVFLFCMLIAPLLCIIFFTTLMQAGLPKKMPVAIVDEDNTHISRIFMRILGSFEQTDIKYVYHDFREARKAVQEGKIYAFYYLPKGLTRDAESSRQPTISFYTNDSYYVPGNLLMRDMKTAGVLSGLGLTRENLLGHGSSDHDYWGIIQPIVIETHPIHNSFLNYAVYLGNVIVPGILILLVLLTTTYAIGLEWKLENQQSLYVLSDKSPAVALAGKLLPQTAIYIIIFFFMDVWFYRFEGFPCYCGLPEMMLISVLTVLATQGFGIFLFGLMAGEMRLAMCICSLWGILSFSLGGFTFPVSAMDTPLQCLSICFPLRHYYLIYVNLALNGYSIKYVWPSVMALAVFSLLPILVLPRYRLAFLKFKYLK